MERKYEDSLNKSLFVVGIVGANNWAVKQEIYKWGWERNQFGRLKKPMTLSNGESAHLELKLENKPAPLLSMYTTRQLRNSITMISVDLREENCIEKCKFSIAFCGQSIEYLCIVCSTEEDKFSNFYQLKRVAKFLNIDVITFDELSTSTRFYELCTKYVNALSQNQYIPIGFHLGQLDTEYIKKCFDLAKENEEKAALLTYSNSSELLTMNDNTCCFELSKYLENEKTGKVTTSQFKRFFVGELLRKKTNNECYQGLLLYGFMNFLRPSEEVKRQLSTENLRKNVIVLFWCISNRLSNSSDVTGVIIHFFRALYEEEDSEKNAVFFYDKQKQNIPHFKFCG